MFGTSLAGSGQSPWPPGHSRPFFAYRSMAHHGGLTSGTTLVRSSSVFICAFCSVKSWTTNANIVFRHEILGCDANEYEWVWHSHQSQKHWDPSEFCYSDVPDCSAFFKSKHDMSTYMYNSIALAQPSEQHVLVVLLKYYLAFLHLPQLLSRVRSLSVMSLDWIFCEKLHVSLGFSKDHCHTFIDHENIMKSHQLSSNSHQILIHSRFLLVDGHQCRHRRVFLCLVCGRRFGQRIQSCLQLLQGCQATSTAKFSVQILRHHSFPTGFQGVLFRWFSLIFLMSIWYKFTLLPSQLRTSCSASFRSAYV